MNRLFVFLFMLTSIPLTAQDIAKFKPLEDSLIKYSHNILYGANDFEKYAANNSFKNFLIKALELPKSNKYGFDSLKTIAKLNSNDEKLRLFIWHIAKSDGGYEYFGVVQSYNRKKKSFRITELADKSESIETPEDDILQADEWYGAHYYQLIENKYKQKKFYTVLGWDGNNSMTTKKIIDVIRLSNTGIPKFGALLFRDNKQTKKRVIFEYSDNVSIVLKYDSQMVDPNELSEGQTRVLRKNSSFKNIFSFNSKKKQQKMLKKKRKKDIEKRKKMEEKEAKQRTRWKRTRKTNFVNPDNIVVNVNENTKRIDMIVFDRIEPMRPELVGVFQFYAPQSAMYDGYVFHKGKWIFVEDVDARNWDMPKIDKNEKPVEYKLLPEN